MRWFEWCVTSQVILFCSRVVQYLRVLASFVEKTQYLAKELQALGCGDLDAEGE